LEEALAMRSPATVTLAVDPEQVAALVYAAAMIRDHEWNARYAAERMPGGSGEFDFARSGERVSEAWGLTNALRGDPPVIDVPLSITGPIRDCLAERMESELTELVQDAATIPLGEHIGHANSTWTLLVAIEDAVARLLAPV
jgi:hypothetical protein